MVNNKAKSKKTPMRIIMFIIKSPITILRKIRDLYVQSITNCSGRMSYNGAMACSTGFSSTNLPRNFSTNSSRESADQDLRELIRAVSQKGGLKVSRINPDGTQQLQQQKQKQENQKCSSGGDGDLTRNTNTGGVLNIETIDENVSCHFDSDIIRGI